MMCSNKTIKVYARNKLNENDLVFFQSSEKRMAGRTSEGGLHRNSGASHFEGSPLSLEQHKTELYCWFVALVSLPASPRKCTFLFPSLPRIFLFYVFACRTCAFIFFPTPVLFCFLFFFLFLLNVFLHVLVNCLTFQFPTRGKTSASIFFSQRAQSDWFMENL